MVFSFIEINEISAIQQAQEVMAQVQHRLEEKIKNNAKTNKEFMNFIRYIACFSKIALINMHDIVFLNLLLIRTDYLSIYLYMTFVCLFVCLLLLIRTNFLSMTYWLLCPGALWKMC